jgi:hypothetical protein
MDSPWYQVCQPDHPFAVGAGGGGLFLAIQRNGHLLAGAGGSPNRHRHAALEHHVVADERRGLDVRECRAGAEQERDKG